MALFMKAAGLQLRHLPTNGGGPALTALLGNNANVAILSLSGALAQIKAGKLRPLALMGGTRAKAIPDVPTMKELGFNIEYYLWVGIFAPKGTPDSAISVLRKAIGEAAHGESVQEPRWPTSGWTSSTWTRRNSRNSGPRIPRASSRRWTPSARSSDVCETDNFNRG